MNIKRFFLLLAAFLLLASCAQQEIVPETVAPQAPASKSQIPGQAIVRVTEELADEFAIGDFPEVAKQLGIVSAERVFPDAGEFEAKHRAAGLHRWYRIQYDPAVAITKARADLAALPGVETVEIPLRKARRSYFNDPDMWEQWHYINDGTRGPAFKAGMDINVEPVWKEFTAGNSEVIVAVIDGGIDLSNPDLGGVTLPGGSNGSRVFLENYPPYEIPGDDHGTHAAGTIGAINNNGKFVAGVAGGRDGKGGVTLMSCVIFDGEEPVGADEAAALVWAADHGAVIANNSWGYVFETEEESAAVALDFEQNEWSLKTAINYFIEYAGTDANGNQTGPMKGGLVTFASGNEGWAHDVPGEYEPVVAVGAFGPDGKMPNYSNYGPWVDILAPGGSDSDDYKEWVVSVVTNNNVGYMVGTSMACPHVSGVAALLVSYYGGPGFTADELKERLLNSAREGVIDLQGRTVGGGMLDAYAAFTYDVGPVDPSQANIKITTDYKGDYSIKSHETLIVDYSITGNNKLRLPVRFETDCPGASMTSTHNFAELTIEALKAEPGEYTAIMHVGSVAHLDIPITILENHAPVVVHAIDNQVINAASSTLTMIPLADCFKDPDGETLSYSVSVNAEGVASARISGGNALNLGAEGYGEMQVTVTAKDARQAQCSTTFQLVSRNTYQELDVFPNPVHDILTVRPGSDAPTTATLYSRSGARVLSQESQAGPFQPIRLDVRNLPAGTYSLQVQYGTKQQVTNIVKY